MPHGTTARCICAASSPRPTAQRVLSAQASAPAPTVERAIALGRNVANELEAAGRDGDRPRAQHGKRSAAGAGLQRRGAPDRRVMAADIPATLIDPSGKPVLTVVITRPAGQSSELIEQLTAAGIATLDFPLIDIAPVTDDAPLRAALASLERYALVVFVSPNAVDHAFAHSDTIWPHALPVGVVGPGSVQALARHGVAAPAYQRHQSAVRNRMKTPARFDSEGLFAAIDTAPRRDESRRQARADRARRRRPRMARRASARSGRRSRHGRGLPAPRAGTVDRRAGRACTNCLRASRTRGCSPVPRACAICTNSRRTISPPTKSSQLKHAALVTPHPRIAQTARALGFDSITVSGAGDERIARALDCRRPDRRSTGIVQPGSFTG